MSRAKILVVDDEAAVLHSTEMLLEMLGYEPIGLKDFAHVVDVAQEEQPLLILQDLRMRNLDLHALMQELRKNRATALIPVVFFSANRKAAEDAAQAEHGAFLAKPFKREELERILREAEERREDSEVTAQLGRSAAQPEVVATEAENLEAVFHEYGNALSAVNVYLDVMAHSGELSDRDRSIVIELDRLFLRLEGLAQELRRRTMRQQAAA